VTATVTETRGRIRVWRYLAFGLCLAELVTSAVVQSHRAAAGAAAGFVGVVLGVLFAARRVRLEISDDDRRESVGKALVVALDAGGPVWLGLVVTYAAVLAWQLNDRHVNAALPAIAAVALVGGVMIGVGAAWRSDGIDRAVLTNSAAFSFCVVMAAAVGYALVESLSSAPRLNMWVVWGVGGASWAISSVIIGRRLS
jgi:hypothetical protein